MMAVVWTGRRDRRSLRETRKKWSMRSLRTANGSWVRTTSRSVFRLVGGKPRNRIALSYMKIDVCSIGHPGDFAGDDRGGRVSCGPSSIGESNSQRASEAEPQSPAATSVTLPSRGRPSLLPQHLEDLRGSGLSNETIAEHYFYSETDAGKIRRILNWNWNGSLEFARRLGPCLVIPYLSLDGTVSNLCRIKPDRPRERTKKTTAKSTKSLKPQPTKELEPQKKTKYEQPVGVSVQPYFTRSAIHAIRAARSPLLITEGEKKALAASQAGRPCIGLSGVSAFSRARKKEDGKSVGDRQLIEALAAIDWQDRPVGILFDSDPLINPNVRREVAVLAKLLHEKGAKVFFPELPTGPIGDDGLPGKMGIDDFIVQNGEAAFRLLVDQAFNPVNKVREIADYRDDLRNLRVESVHKPAIYVDASETGAGKSTADLALKQANAEGFVVGVSVARGGAASACGRLAATAKGFGLSDRASAGIFLVLRGRGGPERPDSGFKLFRANIVAVAANGRPTARTPLATDSTTIAGRRFAVRRG